MRRSAQIEPSPGSISILSERALSVSVAFDELIQGVPARQFDPEALVLPCEDDEILDYCAAFFIFPACFLSFYPQAGLVQESRHIPAGLLEFGDVMGAQLEIRLPPQLLHRWSG
jgi:hypothetical protein